MGKADKAAKLAALKKKLSEAEHKMSELESALSGLNGVDFAINEAYNGGDASDLYGNKYDEMKDDETKAIKGFKSNFDDKKSAMMEKIHSQERVLAYKLNSLNTQLRLSEIWDAITNK